MDSTTKKKVRTLLIIGQPYPSVNAEALILKYIEVLRPNIKNIQYVGGTKINDTSIDSTYIVLSTGKNIFFRLYNYIKIQILIGKTIFSKDFDIVVLLPHFYIIIFLLLKLRNKKIFIHMGGRASKSLSFDDNKFLIFLIKRIEYFILRFSYKIVVQSPQAAKFLELNKFKEKLIVIHQGVDTKKFSILKKYSQRENQIGFIGTFNNVKGSLEFFLAARLLTLENKSNLIFILIGGGNNSDQFESYFHNEPFLKNNIFVYKWVNHQEMNETLNNFKLLVIPSYSEGLPNLLLEAMASGTPVLATPVGGIPDLIFDENTGFLLENNSPDSIAKGIRKAMNHPDIENIISRARSLVQDNYNINITKNKWNIELMNLCW